MKKNQKMSEEQKKKISKKLMGNKNGLGHKLSKEIREKMSKSRLERKKRLGYLNSPETRTKMGEWQKGKTAWNKGKKMPKSMGEKMKIIASKRLRDKAGNWIDGRSFEPYTCEFNNRLKLRIRRRDKFICQKCNVNEKDYFQKLGVHHIDYDKYNCNEHNLITLCRSCNAKVNKNRNYWSNYFKEKLQRL